VILEVAADASAIIAVIANKPERIAIIIKGNKGAFLIAPGFVDCGWAILFCNVT